VLHAEGYDDHLAGHITYKQADGTFLVNPFDLAWDEVTASDILRMDAEGTKLEGRWNVTPAIKLHTELHRQRHDVNVALHNHTRWATIYADAHRVPEVYDQSSAMYPGEVALYNEYDGAVNDVSNARAAVEAIGSADVALLANHGVFVMAPTIQHAYLRAITIEWRSRQAWHVEAIGGGVPLKPEVVQTYGSMVDARGWPSMFLAACRKAIRTDPSVLD
jgi:L-fuculose-phosphate aldolase